MIKNVPVFDCLFKQIQKGRNNINIYVYCHSDRKFEKGDILRLEEQYPTPSGEEKSGYFMHVEVSRVTKVEEDSNGNKIYMMIIKPRLDKSVKLHTLKGA
ncbi:DUF3850 domain-containing protein [Candidatus Stoquefichus sp. SB1]|uniref:DUF3850 domain-containing protein n=1 Tax=Candidatus Stoquefichus sp. SB1 TaxID=1658109 RepID=UPI00067F368F|nr:DUF3850 domain-containing protein [Candidatus Stoquefichus sp. SB1]